MATQIPSEEGRAATAAPTASPVTRSRDRHLRLRDGSPQPTTPVELLFDLVYVIAVTQLSHLVIHGDISLASLGQAAFLLLVAWWAWTYTTWLVNWFDPASGSVRLVLLLAGLASLLMSAAIPDAFGADALLFACAYVGMQVGRNLAGTLLLDPRHGLRRTFERISIWSLASAPLWIAGATLDRPIVLWAPAMALELLGPAVGYRVPGMGRSRTDDWAIEGSHFAERFQAFIIIALGESIAVTGTSVVGGLHGLTLVALGVAFLETGALWWLYFGEVAEHSRRHLAGADDPGRLARDAYTYLHLPIVAGIIMVAVGDEFLVRAPTARPSAAVALMLVGGPVLYLAGESGFRMRMIGSFSLKRLSAVLALALTGLLALWVSSFVLATVLSLWLTVLAFAEYPPLREWWRARRGVLATD